MNAYVFLILYIIFLWLATKKGKVFCTINLRKQKKINFFTALAFFACFFLSSVRNKSVGSDTINYIDYYKKVGMLSWKGFIRGEWNNRYFTTEKGFMIFEKICGDLMIPTQIFIALCAGIFVYGIYKLSENYVKESVLLAAFSFLAVGSYLMSINALRQGVAVGLCYAAWVELKNGKKKRFIVEVLLACTFHVSCCVFFIALIFEKISAGKRKALILTAGSIIFGTVGASVLPLVLRWFPIYSDRYGHGRWKINEANGIVVVWGIVIAIVIALALKKDWRKKENHIDFEIMLFSLCYVCINIIGLSFDGAQRLSMLFQPFLILLFDKSCGLWHGKAKSVYTAGVVAGMLLLFIRASSTAQYTYLSFWV